MIELFGVIVNRNFLKWMLIAVALSGCSNQQVYTAVQKNRQTECEKLPQAQYEQYMKDYEQSYDDYARDRERVLQDE